MPFDESVAKLKSIARVVGRHQTVDLVDLSGLI